MKPVLLVSCAVWLAAATDSRAEIAVVNADDALQAAIAQTLPSMSEAPHVLKTTWNAKPVAFVDYAVETPLSAQPDYKTTTVYLTAFVNAEKGYIPLKVDGFEEDGGVAEIRAIGFANADGDAPTELIVIAAWQFRSADNTGTFYEVRLYDDIASDGADALRPLPSVTGHFGMECDCNGKTARFKTIAAVRKELKRLGY